MFTDIRTNFLKFAISNPCIGLYFDNFLSFHFKGNSSATFMFFISICGS